MNAYYQTGTTAGQTAGQTTTSVGLGLPTQILGIPTWVWVIGGAVFFLIHKGKL
jgi:hypothetical protein